MCIGKDERVGAIGRGKDPVSRALQRSARDRAHRIIVLGEKYRPLTARTWFVQPWLGRECLLISGQRKIDGKRRALTRHRLDVDAPVALLNDAVDGGEPEASALSALFGRKEGLEQPFA